jgi:hypothetical protein
LPDPGANPGCHDGKPATNCFSYGTAKVIEIYRSQFFRSLVANLEKRLLHNFSRSSHEKAKTSSKTESHSDLIQNVKVLFNPSAWGYLNTSSYCDMGRFFYRAFKF